MLKPSQIAGTKLNLGTANVLVVGDKPTDQDVLAQMLMGFGVPQIQRRDTFKDGLRAASTEAFDLSLIEAGMNGGDGFALVADIRRQSKDFTRHLPTILICGHMRRADFRKARDCGANFILTKPLSPQVLFDRVVWLARDQRQFIVSDSYVGPDRRVKAFGPPAGIKGRRQDDLSAHIGEAKEANLSQNAIDGFFGATKVTM